MAKVPRETQPDLQSAIEGHAVCVETARYCLEQGGPHATPEHISLPLECAAICEASAGFVLRGSPLHASTCAVCAEECRRCAESCRSMAGDTRWRVTAGAAGVEVSRPALVTRIANRS